MLNYADAERLARTWVDIVSRGTGEIRPHLTRTKPYGWVFFWNSREFIDTKDRRKALAGNTPIIVDRIDGELRVMGTASPVEDSLAEYEATLPPARLQLTPEPPAKTGG